jgi:hypothetical protein
MSSLTRPCNNLQVLARINFSRHLSGARSSQSNTGVDNHDILLAARRPDVSLQLFPRDIEIISIQKLFPTKILSV